jgi:hypothetical protein
MSRNDAFDRAEDMILIRACFVEKSYKTTMWDAFKTMNYSLLGVEPFEDYAEYCDALEMFATMGLIDEVEDGVPIRTTRTGRKMAEILTDDMSQVKYLELTEVRS